MGGALRLDPGEVFGGLEAQCLREAHDLRRREQTLLEGRSAESPIVMLIAVTSVMHLATLGHEALAAFFAATAKDIAAVFGLHASTESELAFASALGGLIGPFGHGLGLG
jgi:hypothetical protein